MRSPLEQIVISLMDKNYSNDDLNSQLFLVINDLELDAEYKSKTLYFSETSEVDFAFKMTKIQAPDLRYSLALCGEEKYFRLKRKETIAKNMLKLLGKLNGPKNIRHTPTIAVIGSGGGFRAMTGMAGAMKALQSTGILDCCTYSVGLSGSSWYLSTLYANKDVSVVDVNKEIRNRIIHNKLKLLSPEKLRNYVKHLWEKHKRGQPVSFADIFGCMVGEVLLGKHNMNTRLSEFQNRLTDFKHPMPILTAVVVKPKESAMRYHEWVEFSPFEIGMAKYATFMKPNHFGSQFFMGTIINNHPEYPLHFLQGIWGSAFSILIHRVLEPRPKGSKNSAPDIIVSQSDEVPVITHENAGQMGQSGQFVDDNEEMHRIMAEQSGQNTDSEDDEEISNSEESKVGCNLFRSTSGKGGKDGLLKRSMSSLIDAGKTIGKWIYNTKHSPTSPETHFLVNRLRSNSSCSVPSTPDQHAKFYRKRESSLTPTHLHPKFGIDRSNSTNLLNITDKSAITSRGRSQRQRRGAICNEGSISFFNKFFLMLNDRISLLSNRGIRAPRILNFMNALNISIEFPLSPFNEEPSIEEENEFDQLEDVIPKGKRVLHIVDGGLAMNLPFPPVLRPQRAVDIIISFDYTARMTDYGNEPEFDPLKQVRLAEKWARIHKLDFPRVPVIDTKKDGLKEVYVISDYENPKSPVIIHFILVNDTYRQYSSPDIPREQGDERGNFKVFENPVYSTFNFTYDQESFDNLSNLMEYNVLNNAEVVREEISQAIKLRRRYRSRCTITKGDILGSSMKEQHKQELISSLARENLFEIS